MKINFSKFGLSLDHLSFYERRFGLFGGLVDRCAMHKSKSYFIGALKVFAPLGLFIVASECLADVTLDEEEVEAGFATLTKYLGKSKWFIFSLCVPVGGYQALSKNNYKAGGGMAAVGIAAPVADSMIKGSFSLLI